MRNAVLDEIVFQVAPLGEPAPTAVPSLAVDVPVASAHKGFTHPVPLFARRPPVAAGEPHWPAYCGMLKDLGIPLQTTVTSLESLSVANVPLRLASRKLDEAFEAIELETAEAIEISCIATTPGGGLPQLPLEAAAWHELKTLVECVRDVAGHTTPIGLGFLVGDVISDVANALATGVDFVILEFAQPGADISLAELDLLVYSIAAARSTCVQSQAAGFPIYVDAPVTRIQDMVKLLALGASAVSIDALARAALPSVQRSATVSHKGMLSGIGGLATPAVPSLAPLRNQLVELLEVLKTRLRQLQLARVGDLSPDHLRALSEHAARLARVRLLS